MKVFSITCTRSSHYGTGASALFHQLSSFGVEVKVLTNQPSIFEAYKKGMEMCAAEPQDIIILCHDDIQLVSNKEEFLASISKCVHKEVGIVGPAGTTYLGLDAVWWNHEHWKMGLHKGEVIHLNPDGEYNQLHTTSYGSRYGQVVVLDGLFLAARKEVWESIGLGKPDYFEGNWDFYDIHYTTQAHLKGYKNYVVNLNLIHQSSGELVGRDSWHKNREAYIKNTELPLTC